MKYIVIIGAVLSVALYYIIAEVIWQMRNRSFRRRLIIGVLIIALLASQIDFISMFTRTDADRVAAAGADTESGAYAAEIAGVRDTESRIITAFAKLPDDISKQVVPVGTALEELVLPDTLEAVCVKADTDADTDTKTDADTSDSQVGEGSVDQGDGEEVVPGENAGQEDETAEHPDGDSEEEPQAQSAADTAMQTETGSFTMPEYQAGNVIEVKTLEMVPAANYESIEETIIIENITWQPVPEYDGDVEGEYIFTAVLPEGYVLTNGAITSQIIVTVGGTDNIALLSVGDVTPLADTHDHSGWEKWTDPAKLPTNAGSYYLDTNVTLSQSWQPSVSITLCLNGHTIEYNGSNPTIGVNSSRILDIYDCQGSGTVTKTNSSGYTLRIKDGGTANIYGGKFINNTNRSTIINDDGGTLNMSGGEITYTNGGDGIDNSGDANVKNVKIKYAGSNNDDDSGIYCRGGGTITVENCEIESGTGVCVYVSYGTAKIIGGTFNGRYGIYNNSGTFELSGSPTFTGSIADIYLSDDQKITVTGALGNAKPYSVLTETAPTEISPVVFTTGATTYNDTTKFTAADSNYAVRKNSDGQLELAASEHTHDDIIFEPWTITTDLPDSGSYYLYDDVTLSSPHILSGSLTLCLNGHTITYDKGLPIRVDSGRTLGIYDCQGNGEVTTAKSYCIRIFSRGTANIYGGTFNSTDNEAITVDVEGIVTIENASVFSSNSRAILNNGMATINGGTFKNTATGYPTIQLQSGSTTIITGGKFIRNTGSNVIQNQGKLEMSGGTVTGSSSSSNGAVGIVNSGTSATATIKDVTITTEGTATDDNTKADKGLRNDNGGTMTVENCNVNSTNRAVWNTGGSTIKISGGTFNGRYGIYNNNGKFELSGSPTISGSTADIYLSSNQKITVAGTLGNAAPYSVLTATAPTVGSPVEITNSGNTDYNNADKFTPANNSYILRKNSSDQLELAVLATYTITYASGNASGVTGSHNADAVTEGESVTLPGAVFTRTGYSQTGWSIESDGSTNDYGLNATFTPDSSITLYPYWTANQYTVSFNSAGGSSVSNITVTFDGAYGELVTPTRTGYKFDGWYTAETGGTKVESDTKVTIADNHTLYAKWTANEYGIIYKDQGGAPFSGTHESGHPTKHTYGTATTLKSASKTGFTFSGWYTNSSCTGSAVTSLGATGYTSDITLYAKWTGPEYDITYMDQGGEAFSGTHESGYPTKHAYGTATTLKSASKTGYTFGGWYTDSSCTNKVTSLGATDYTSDITLYAKWTKGTVPPKTDGGSSSGGGGSTGGNNGGSSSESGNGSQSSDNNSGGSSSEDTPSDSVTPPTATTPPKTDTVETKTPDPDSNKKQKKPSGQKTDHETDTASPVETKPVTEPQKEQTKDTQTDTTALTVGEGTVRVTVVSDGYQYAAGVTDTEAVADAVLTPEQIQLVSGGESIEIRVEVTDISDQVSQQDRNIIERGLADHKITGDTDGEGELTLGAYIDISMYIRIGDGDWDAITKAGEPIEVVIGIPDDLLSDERTYYIARSHEGDFALLNDLDSEPDTITIKTELFSTYAIVYRQMSGTGADGFPGFLASLSWTAVALWSLGILVMLGIVIFLIFWKRRKEEEEEVS